MFVVTLIGHELTLASSLIFLIICRNVEKWSPQPQSAAQHFERRPHAKRVSREWKWKKHRARDGIETLTMERENVTTIGLQKVRAKWEWLVLMQPSNAFSYELIVFWSNLLASMHLVCFETNWCLTSRKFAWTCLISRSPSCVELFTK